MNEQEEIYAISRTREFLRSLVDPSKTPRITKTIRKEASSCLRHYPLECHENAIEGGLKHYYKMKGIAEMFNSMDNDAIPNDVLIAAADKFRKQKKTELRVDVSLDLTDEDFILIAKAAHREGMSLNDWVNMALGEVLEGDLEYELDLLEEKD
jgi:hypothetical protein